MTDGTPLLLPCSASGIHPPFRLCAPAAHFSLIAGVLILLIPRLLNYIVAIYVIIVGLIGLGVVR